MSSISFKNAGVLDETDGGAYMNTRSHTYGIEFMSTNIRLPLAAAMPDSSPRRSDEMGDEAGVGAVVGVALMQIGDLARESGKSIRAIHLYEEIGLLRPAGRSKGRFRLYASDALVRIRWIGKLQDMGFSLTDIQAVVREWEQLASAPEAMVRMREVYRKKLDETREQIRKLEALEHEMEASLHYLDTCEVCDPDRLLSACSHCDRHGCGEQAPELVAGFRAQPS
jgi:DNA-binding transcriptional MerR regulator